MKKKIFIAIGCIVALALVIAFILLKKDTLITEQVTGGQPAPPAIRQDTEFIESLFNGVELRHGMSSDGLYTLGHITPEEGQRILEVHFLKRDIFGHLSPLDLDFVIITGDIDLNWDLGESSSGIRMAISGTGPRSRVTHLGGKYTIERIRIHGDSHITRTSPLEPSFTIPENLPVNSLYKVELIVLDEQFNKKFADEKEIERQRYEQRVKEESITVNLTKAVSGIRYPAAFYMEEKNEIPFNLGRPGYANENSPMIIRGPNKLGGELIVADIMEGSSGMPFLWSYAYIRKLDKRNVNIPEDADLITQTKEMIPVTVAFDAANALPESEKLVYLGFFERMDSKLPLLIIGFDTPKIEMKDNRYELDFLITPGSYFLKLLGCSAANDTDSWSDFLDLGTIEIKPDQQRYEIIIPESTDWDKLNKM